MFLSGCTSGPGEYDAFANCLTEEGVVMYGTEWCSHCQNQKKMFGSSFEYINFVDCDKNKNECLDKDIQGYPTWRIDGKNYPGEQSINDLKTSTGCEL
ncbi:MAG: hypothetical protein KJ674_02365 [Nanoarchaeota archaeon]|nr:hypothetical protein [Nanoarchaeota archaeon]